MLRSQTVTAGLIVVLAMAGPLSADDNPGGASSSQDGFAIARSEPLRFSVAREAARIAASRSPAVRADATFVDAFFDPQPSWISRHPVLTGALVGAATGAVWGYVVCRGACEGDPRLYMLFYGGVGAGIGAGTGALIGAIAR